MKKNSRFMLWILIPVTFLFIAVITTAVWNEVNRNDELREGILPRSFLDTDPNNEIDERNLVEHLEEEGSRDKIAILESGEFEDSGIKENRLCFRVRFLNETGAPVAGVRVTTWPTNVADNKVSDSHGCLVGRLRKVKSDSQFTIHMRAEKEGFERLEKDFSVTLSEGLDLGDVILKLGGIISGRVVTELGKPVSNAEVYCTVPDLHGIDLEKVRVQGPRFRSSSERISKTLSVTNGTFHLPGVPSGKVCLLAGKRDTYWTVSEPLEVPVGGQLTHIELVLESRPASDCIEGIVFYPDGNPAPSATVEGRYRTETREDASNCKADEKGHFRIELGERVPHTIRAYDSERKYEFVEVQDVAPGTLDLMLQFTNLRRNISLFVHDVRGKPLSQFTVNVLLQHKVFRDHQGNELWRDERLDKTYAFLGNKLGENGVTEIPIPGEEFWLTVEAERYLSAELGSYYKGTVPDEIAIEMVSIPGVLGRVTAENLPMERVKVGLHKTVAFGSESFVEGFVCRSQIEPCVTDETDTSGQFCLWLKQSGAFYLRAEVEGYAAWVTGPMVIDHIEGVRDIEIVLGQGGAIEGKLLAAAGRDPSGFNVGISCGDGHPIFRQIGSDGSFRFDHLIPGNWQVQVRDRDRLNKRRWINRYSTGDPASFEKQIPWDCVVEEGKTTIFNFDLTLETECSLAGIFTIDGSLPPGWTASLSEDRLPNSDISRAVLKNDGSFRILNRKAGYYRLTIRGPLGEGRYLLIEDRVTLSAGETSWKYEMYLGKLVLSGVLSSDRGGVHYAYRWKGPGGPSAVLDIRPASEGSVMMLSLPAGKGELVQICQDPVTGERAEVVLSVLDVSPGEVTTVELKDL